MRNNFFIGNDYTRLTEYKTNPPAKKLRVGSFSFYKDRSASASAAADEGNIVKQLQDGGDETGDIGQRGGIQYSVDSALLFFGLDDTSLGKQLLRPGRGIKLHGQGGQCKDCAARKYDHAQRGQLGKV